MNPSNFLVGCLLGFCVGASIGQELNSQTWLVEANESDQALYAVAALPDNRVVLSRTVQGREKKNKHTIELVSGSGRPVWQFTLPSQDPTGITTGTTLGDGSLLIAYPAGDRAYEVAKVQLGAKQAITKKWAITGASVIRGLQEGSDGVPVGILNHSKIVRFRNDGRIEIAYESEVGFEIASLGSTSEGFFIAGTKNAGKDRYGRAVLDGVARRIQEDGSVVWERRLPSGVLTGALGVSQSQVILAGYRQKDIGNQGWTDEQSYVITLDRQSGKEMWSKGLGHGKEFSNVNHSTAAGLVINGANEAIVLTENYVSASSCDSGDAVKELSVDALDTNGRVLWSKTLGSNGVALTAFRGVQRPLVASTDGNLFLSYLTSAPVRTYTGHRGAVLALGKDGNQLTERLSYAQPKARYCQEAKK